MSIVGESRRVLVLGLLACVLGGYTYVTTPARKALTSKVDVVSERPIFTFNAEKIGQFDVLYEGKHVIGKRTSEGWKTPDGMALPSSAINDFLGNVTKLINLGEVEKGRDDKLSDYGLEPPVTQIALEVEGEGAQRLAIGRHNPVNTSLYAQVNQSSQIVLVGSIISWELRKLTDVLQSAANAG
jgi:Domain of unknown function (DUF4340)